MKTAHIMIVDPAIKLPELDCFNNLTFLSKLPLTYHLPALYGMDSLQVNIHGIQGIVILGSGISVYERLPWQLALENWLEPLARKKIPILALCYGHQMIARLFGGEVGFLYPDKRKWLDFRSLSLEPNRLWGARKLKGRVFASHRETVVRCPPDMQVVGKSLEVSLDALAHKKLPIWTFQPHPESTGVFLKNQGFSGAVQKNAFAFGHLIVSKFFDFCYRNRKK